MNMREVYSHFNLSGNPFSKEIKTVDLKDLPGIKDAKRSVEILLDTRGIGVISGKSGTGKTCLLRSFAESLPEGLFKTYYVCHTSVGILEFYSHLCSAFGLEPSGRRAPMFKAIHNHILNMNQTNHIHPVLIIDEADKLGNDILQEIRLISNFHYDSWDAVTIILTGQEYLVQKFGLSILESLANSVVVTVRMDTLKKEETFSYIEQRVSDVSAGNSVFSKSAMSLIHNASGGVMRVINNMGTHSLTKAYLSNSAIVEKEHVQAILSR